jgi:beta-galactosidase
VREYDWTFGSGQKVNRTFGIFNDTQYSAPMTFTRTVMVGKKQVSTKASVHNIAAGGELKFAETLALPAVTSRTDGQLIVALSVGGKEVFRDTKPFSVLAPVKAATAAAPAAKPAVKRTSLRVETRSNAQVKPASSTVYVYDPQGKVASQLKAIGMAFTAVKSLAALPTGGRVLIVGSDALSASDSTSTALAAWAATGRSVIVLDQKHPLRYQALTAEISTVSNDATESAQTNGQVAFPEDLNHPSMRNLRGTTSVAGATTARFIATLISNRRAAHVRSFRSGRVWNSRL